MLNSRNLVETRSVGLSLGLLFQYQGLRYWYKQSYPNEHFNVKIVLIGSVVEPKRFFTFNFFRTSAQP